MSRLKAATMRHPNSQRFHDLLEEIADGERFRELLKELGELHDRKQEDYGAENDPFANVRSSEEWGVPPWVGALIRMNDKVKRLQAFARKGSLTNESVEDSLKDIPVYALIALILYEQESIRGTSDN